jgi:hypothetical protein
MSPLMYTLADEALTYKSETVYGEFKDTDLLVPIKAPAKNDVKELITRHFTGHDAKVAYAIIKAESNGNARSVGYNCYYTKDGKVHRTRVKGAYSTFCKKEHRQHAWSVDCGKVQRNFPGRKECPEYAFDPEWSIAEMKRLHNQRGWQPWVTYTSGKYLAYME